MTKLTEKTTISISLMLALLGGVFWLSTIYSQSVANAKALEKISVEQLNYNKNLEAINTRLSRIEGALDIR